MTGIRAFAYKSHITDMVCLDRVLFIFKLNEGVLMDYAPSSFRLTAIHSPTYILYECLFNHSGGFKPCQTDGEGRRVREKCTVQGKG